LPPALEAKGFEIDRRKIQLDEPLKSVGEFSVAIKLYREVTAHVKVKIVAEATEEAQPPSPLPKLRSSFSQPTLTPPFGSLRGGSWAC